MIFDKFRKKTPEPQPKETIVRELYLIRHADALDEFSRGDIGRVLSDKGFQQAEKTAQFLNKSGVLPDVIIHSGAVRTMSTAETIALVLGKEISLIEASALYNVSADEWLAFIHSIDNDLRIVVAVGHNFGISEFASQLNGSTLDRLENAAVYGFQFHIDTWDELKKGRGKLIIQFTPV
ncbi:MAG: hypothetical protein HKM04_12030 [Legionellales bacterium]|nr:hypothetical protein [Legionellales bacterium]